MQWWHDLWWSNPCYCLFWFCLCLMSLFCKLQAIAQCLYLSLIAAMAPLPAMDDFAHIEAEFQLFLACFHPQSFVFVFPDCGLQLRFSNFLEHPQNICNALTAGRHSPYHIITLEPGQTLHFSNWLKTWQKVALEEKNFTQKQGIYLMKCICRGHASTSQRYSGGNLENNILNCFKIWTKVLA